MSSNRGRPPKRPLQVTIVAHHVGPIGGMERQLTELISGLLKRGHAVTVVARRCDFPRHPAFRWLRVRGPAKPFPFGYLSFFIVASWNVWRHRAGLLHTTGAIVWNRADLCTIHYCHHAAQGKTDMAWTGLSVLRRVNRRLSEIMARFAEGILYRPSKTRQFVAVSEGVAREMREHFPKVSSNITVIPNAFDQQLFRPDPIARGQVRGAYGLSGSDFVVLFVGGDWDRKGLPIAVQAVAPLRRCHLLVVGPGDAERPRKMAHNLGCAERVHFAGLRKDTARHYAAADVFLLPSVYETFSLVTYEAAACGLPLLVTRVSGVEDILIDGENGWFIHRDPQMITSRLQALQTDEALRTRMGAKSREAVAPYSWPRVIDDYVRLYERLASKSSSAVPVLDSLSARPRG